MTSHPPHFDTPGVPEMATRFQTTDWSNTPLGPQEGWPQSLKIIVSVMFASGFPMCVRWGPQLMMIYNDGYRSILGDRHPRAFGVPFHEAWPEVQEQLRPLHEAILNGTSGAYFAEDLLIKVQRRGKPEWEDARFTLSYSPIPDDAAPTGVGGVLVTVVETTDRVRTEEALHAPARSVSRVFLSRPGSASFNASSTAGSFSSTGGFAKSSTAHPKNFWRCGCPTLPILTIVRPMPPSAGASSPTASRFWSRNVTSGLTARKSGSASPCR